VLLERIPSEFIRRQYKKFGIEVFVDEVSYVQCNNCHLRYYEPLVGGDESFYDRLQQLEWYYQDTKPEYEVAARHIPPHCRVLEVGSGKGAFAAALQECEYVGLEYSGKAVERARASGLDVRKEPLEDFAAANEESFDIVCAFQVLEHVVDPKGFLSNLLRCLKVGGRLVLSVPSEDSFMKYLPNNIMNMPPHHLTRWTDRCLLGLQRLFDIKLIDIRRDELDSVNVSNCCNAVSYRIITNMLHFRQSVVDERFLKFPFRTVQKKLARLLVPVFSEAKIASGHSVTVLYVKNN
jgi:SAM-dependent methyltransferase